MSSNKQKVKIEDLSLERLPKRVIDEIKNIELTVEELIVIEEKRPGLRVIIDDDNISISVSKRIPSKKAVVTLGSIISVSWALFEFVAPHVHRIF